MGERFEFKGHLDGALLVVDMDAPPDEPVVVSKHAYAAILKMAHSMAWSSPLPQPSTVVMDAQDVARRMDALRAKHRG